MLFYYNKVVIFVETNRENMETLNAKQLETVIERLVVIMEENPTMDENKAIELAFKQEQDFISEMLEQKTERSKKAKEQICKNVYGLSHIFN